VALGRRISAILRGLSVILMLRVLASILANYGDYFPADFDSLFLAGREATFTFTYQIAFYSHIIASPLILVGIAGWAAGMASPCC
jgi:hypothetical protein